MTAAAIFIFNNIVMFFGFISNAACGKASITLTGRFVFFCNLLGKTSLDRHNHITPF